MWGRDGRGTCDAAAGGQGAEEVGYCAEGLAGGLVGGIPSQGGVESTIVGCGCWRWAVGVLDI